MTSRRRSAGSYAGLLLLSAFCLLPLLWMVSTSLKPLEETFVSPPRWIPEHPTIAAYANAWSIQSFGTYFANTAIVTVATAILAVALGSLAGYGFSRFPLPGKSLLMGFTLSSQMFPGVLLVIPYFIAASRLGLFNTHVALIIAYTSFALPFCVWMLKGFFDRIPRELDEAAMLDGADRLNVFLRVVVPLARPGIIATAIFSALVAWNEFLFAVALTSSPKMYLLTVGITSNLGQFRVQWNDLMATAVLAVLPVIALYALLQRHLVAGMTAGAVKG